MIARFFLTYYPVCHQLEKTRANGRNSYSDQFRKFACFYLSALDHVIDHLAIDLVKLGYSLSECAGQDFNPA